jgi:hypothetical protein
VHSLGEALLIVALVAVILAFLLAAVPWEIKWEHTTKPLKERWAAPAALSAACAVLVAGGGFLYESSSGVSQKHIQKHGHSVKKLDTATIHFSDPIVTTQDPVPTVLCQDNVEVQVVKGHLPTGDTIVIGNGLRGEGTGNVAFVADATQTAAGTWQAHIFVGQRKDKGKLFTLYVMTMPSAWAKYMNGLSYWNGQGLPPSPAQLKDQEPVRRSRTSTAGCLS